MKKDYFAVLGLRPGATDKEIRSAYKKLAKKYHPDVNPGDRQAEEKFKEIGEAYDVLTDPEKRRRWESGDFDFEAFFRERGRTGGRGRARPGGADPFTTFRFGGPGDLSGIFEDLFGDVAGASRQGAARHPSQGRDIQYEASITFEEAVRGTTLKIPLARNETLQVRIPPGARDGSRVRVGGKGEAGPGGGPAGDLFVVLAVQPHAYYRREGQDVILDVPLTVSEAALGTRIDVPTIDGRVRLTVPAGSRSGQRLRLKGRGVPARDGAARGDQIVVLQIVTPQTLDARSRKILEELQRLNPADPRAALGW